jgi:hypothetical protein
MARKLFELTPSVGTATSELTSTPKCHANQMPALRASHFRFQVSDPAAPRTPPHALYELRYDVCGSWYDMQTAVSHTGRYEWGFFQVEVTPSLQYGRPVRS